jgi:hypothetical protein
VPAELHSLSGWPDQHHFLDPEGNTVEVYLDTPWYVPQPHGDPLGLEKSDSQIWAEIDRGRLPRRPGFCAGRRLGRALRHAGQGLM